MQAQRSFPAPQGHESSAYKYTMHSHDTPTCSLFDSNNTLRTVPFLCAYRSSQSGTSNLRFAPLALTFDYNPQLKTWGEYGGTPMVVC
jgi:hypothetical protein